MTNKAIIWDMDGVISDTQSLHARVESELLARYDIRLSPTQITAKYAGVRTADFFKDLLEKKGAKGYDIGSLMAEKWEIATGLVHEVKAIPGAIKIIKKADKENIFQAVASASGSRYVANVLEQLEVRGYFNSVVSGDQVTKGKPDPEIFLTAAKRIGVSPYECVVIEDGRAGMIGAKKAGMKCIGLVNHPGDYPATLLVNSLTELNLERILNL